MSLGSVGIVVPTLGRRTEYLFDCIRSIRNAGDAHVSLVAPAGLEDSLRSELPGFDSFIIDPGGGPSAAINAGIRSLPPTVEYASWLGDDDLLEEDSLTETRARLVSDNAVFVWGMCRYIDSRGRQIFVNRSGPWALKLAAYGPNLVPQPGSLFLRSAFAHLGGLDEGLGWAFDQDLFARLATVGRCTYMPRIVANFRWHPDSLSAGARSGSVSEASLVRRRYYGRRFRPFIPVWEPAVRQANSLAGKVANARANAMSRRHD